MAEDKQALLDHYRQSREEMLATINGLTDEQITERSLDGWSVKDHLAHLAAWDDIRAREVARISAGHASAWRMTGDQGEQFNAISYATRADLSVDQIKWEYATSRQRLLDYLRGVRAIAKSADTRGSPSWDLPRPR